MSVLNAPRTHEQEAEPCSVSLWSTRSEIERIAPEWDDLFGRSPRASVYLSRVWMLSWLDARPARPRLAVYGVRRGGRLVALLPLMRSGRLGLSSPIGTGESAYLGLLLDESEPGAVAAVVEALNRHERFVYSHDLFSDDAATNALFDALRASGWTIRTWKRNPVFLTELPDSFDRYLTEHKSSRSRQTLRRKERQLENSYRVGIERFRGGEITEEVITRCAGVQEQSWMVRRGADTMSRQSTVAVVRSLAEAGLASVWMLTLDGEDAAFVVCFGAHGTVDYKYPSFSLRYPASLSLGNYLISRLIRDLIEDGAKVLDFGHGDAEYKRFWGNVEHRVDRVAAGRGLAGRAGAVGMSAAWRLGESKRLRSLIRRIRSRS